MKTQKIVFIVPFISSSIGIVASIQHMFMFGANKANVTTLLFLSTMLFLSVTLFKKDLNKSNNFNIKKSNDKESTLDDVRHSNCNFATSETSKFSYERIDDKWLSKLKSYKKPLNDGLEPMDYWYINHEKNEAIYYIGWVSDAILKCGGYDLYEFAFAYNNICIHVEAEIFHSIKGWDERNKLRYDTGSITEVNLQLLKEDIKEAILYYINNIYKDRKRECTELIQNKESEDIEIENGPEFDDEQYKKFAESAAQRVIKETEIPCMAINLEDKTTSIFDSKVGGIPYLPKDFGIPLDTDGNQMKLLAQIDCNNLKGLKDYPHEGILQFWMTKKWAWEEAKVIYHKEVDRSITEKEVIQKTDELEEDDKHCFPIDGSYGMKFTFSSESISRYDHRLKALFCQYFTEISGEYISDPEYAESENVYSVFVNNCEEYAGASGNSHKVGGYRYSTQFGSWGYDDYKKGDKIDVHSDEADILLFQLGSEYASLNFETRTRAWIKVMWCDDGVGRFSIKRSELKKCNFDNAWFSWDCF